MDTVYRGLRKPNLLTEISKQCINLILTNYNKCAAKHDITGCNRTNELAVCYTLVPRDLSPVYAKLCLAYLCLFLFLSLSFKTKNKKTKRKKKKRNKTRKKKKKREWKQRWRQRETDSVDLQSGNKAVADQKKDHSVTCSPPRFLLSPRP